MPLHRSITFWLGLFILISGIWAWHDSASHSSGLNLNFAGKLWRAHLLRSCMVVSKVDLYPGVPPLDLIPERNDISNPMPPLLSFPRLTTAIELSGSHDIHIVALWPLVPVFLIAWPVLLYWSYRRWRKRSFPDHPSPAQPQTDL